MKNFYEILEINQNASQEIVDKAYKVLIKKYHPDLQTSTQEKAKCEEKIKLINEAYETISNSKLRAEYDRMLEEQNNEQLKKEEQQFYEAYNQVQQRKYEEQIRQQANQHQEKIRQQNNQYKEAVRQNEEYQKQYRNAINKAYHDAYIQDLKNRGYKIKYKKTLNERLRSLIALLITIGIIILVLQLPFVKNYIEDLYKNNEIIHSIVDIINNMFK